MIRLDRHRRRWHAARQPRPRAAGERRGDRRRRRSRRPRRHRHGPQLLLRAAGGDARCPIRSCSIVHNGAITRARTGETLMRRMLSRDLARDVLGHTRGMARTCRAALRSAARRPDGATTCWTGRIRTASRFKARNKAIIQQVSVLEDALTEDPIQLTFNGEVAADARSRRGARRISAGAASSRSR